MDIPFLCSDGSLVSLGTGLEPFWMFVAFALTVAIAIFAIISCWVSPVAAPLARAERQRQGAATFWIIVFSSSFSIAALVVSLLLTIFPVGCATHAYLISAHVPQGANDWPKTAAKFESMIRATARSQKRKALDLAPIRNHVLDHFADAPTTVFDGARIPEMVHDALELFSQGRLPPSAALPGLRREEHLDARFVETVEVAVLMAWHAHSPGARQRLSYLVSDRAEKFGWDWTLFAGSRFTRTANGTPIAVVKTVPEAADRPRLNRVVSAGGSGDGSALVATLLFEVPFDGKVDLEVQDDAGNLLASETLDLSAGADPAQLISVSFSADAGANLADADRIAQTGADGVVVALPPVRPSPLRVYVEAPAVTAERFRDTLDFLAGRTGCTPDDAALELRKRFWSRSFVVESDGKPILSSTIDASDVVLYVRRVDGALFILPTRSLRAGAVPPLLLPFLGDRSPETVVPSSDPTVTGDVLVLWDLSGAGKRLSANRLSLPVSAGAFQKVLPGGTAKQIPRDRLFATAELPSRISTRRLRLDAYTTVAGMLERRFEATDLRANVVGVSDSVVLSATLLSLDLAQLSLLCGGAIHEAERFLGVWRLIIDRMLTATTPRVVVSIGGPRPTGVPEIAFTQANLQEIHLQRLEVPLYIALVVLTFYLLTVAGGYFRASRLRRDI